MCIIEVTNLKTENSFGFYYSGPIESENVKKSFRFLEFVLTPKRLCERKY